MLPLLPLSVILQIRSPKQKRKQANNQHYENSRDILTASLGILPPVLPLDFAGAFMAVGVIGGREGFEESCGFGVGVDGRVVRGVVGDVLNEGRTLFR